MNELLLWCSGPVMSRRRFTAAGVPLVACAAGSALVVGVLLFGLRGGPVDFRAYMPSGVAALPPAGPPQPPLATREDRTTPDRPGTAPTEPAPPPDPAPPPEAAPAQTGREPEASPRADAAEALALLTPEPPRRAAPAAKTEKPRVRPGRKRMSAVKHRARAITRQSSAMRTITIFHGTQMQVVRVPR